MLQPKDHLIYAADVGSLNELKEQLKNFSDNIGAVKLGMEIVTHAFLTGEPIFQYVLEETVFRIMLDLKFADIPATVAGAARETAKHGQGRILGFTVHCSSGPKPLLQAVEEVKKNFGEGPDAPLVIAVTLLTSLDQDDLNLLGIQGTPEEVVLRWAKMAADCNVPAIVCSPKETRKVLGINDRFIVINPGIRFYDSELGCQKRAATPAEAIENGASYIVMGTDLRKGSPAQNAKRAVAEIVNGLTYRELP